MYITIYTHCIYYRVYTKHHKTVSFGPIYDSRVPQVNARSQILNVALQRWFALQLEPSSGRWAAQETAKMWDVDMVYHRIWHGLIIYIYILYTYLYIYI